MQQHAQSLGSWAEEAPLFIMHVYMYVLGTTAREIARNWRGICDSE